MNRIRLLPEQVANQIAAGEVVERPASVVKELVENALDAQATRIVVEAQAGGRSLIRVTDDGLGMSRDDALLAFERHATSKIQRAEDLSAVTTMGFRGEALPSLASVSRLTLTTRERDATDPAATQVLFQGGKLVDVRSAAGPVGTCVEVRHLFANLPARRKFLKSQETERVHLQQVVLLAALAFPEVGFTFLHDQRTVWQLPACPVGESPAGRRAALQERLRALLGPDLALVPVDHGTTLRPRAESDPTDREEPGVTESEPASALRLWGFIGAPGVSRATRENQHLFVNRRPVENRALNFALLEGYHTALMKGRYPVACLFLEIDPALVDVNIHPAKREVKFREEWAVRHFVSHGVRRALLAYHAADAPPPAETPPATPAPVDPAPLPLPGLGPATALSTPAEAMAPPAAAPFALRPEPVPPAAPAPPPAPVLPLGFRQPARSVGSPTSVGSAGSVPLLSVPLRILGVIGRLYVIMESDRGLVLLDQHAAHERVLFEEMLQRLEQGAAPCQRLLLPETVELSARDAQFLREQLPVLGRLGVSLSEFGERTFLLDGLPPFVKAAHPRTYVLELIDDLKLAGQEVNTLRLGEAVVAKTVCRHAVKANDPLTDRELEGLLADLRQCAMPYTCPHGRPTLIEMSYRELERKFGRSA